MQQKIDQDAPEATDEGSEEPHDDQELKKYEHEQAVTGQDIYCSSSLHFQPGLVYSNFN